MQARAITNTPEGYRDRPGVAQLLGSEVRRYPGANSQQDQHCPAVASRSWCNACDFLQSTPTSQAEALAGTQGIGPLVSTTRPWFSWEASCAVSGAVRGLVGALAAQPECDHDEETDEAEERRTPRKSHGRARSL